MIATRLRADARVNPVGIGSASPTLSWARTGEDCSHPSSFRVVAASTKLKLESGEFDLWDSGFREAASQFSIIYGGEPLDSRRQVHWRVGLRCDPGDETWSDPAFFETGLFDKADWSADWISGPLVPSDGVNPSGTASGDPNAARFRPGNAGSPVFYLASAFDAPETIEDARLYITALGLYEAFLNGSRIGNRALAPGWTDYTKRVEYQTFDIARYLAPGHNVLCIVLSDGWYSGYVGFSPRQRGAFYGSSPAACAQLECDGRTLLVTDERWRAGFGPIVASDLLMGETVDLRSDKGRLLAANPERDNDYGVRVRHDLASTSRVAEVGPPIAALANLPGAHIGDAGDEEIYDFGQNLAGRVELEASGPEGATITIRHAEMLDEDGGLYTANLRTARAEDTVTLAGEGEETYQPSFTFHGFRYAGFSVSDPAVTIRRVTAVVTGSETERTGWFRCGHAGVGKLYDNAMWSQLGNFLSIPTDCPQRDERMGWTGDAQTFCRTAAYNRDVQAFFRKWLIDILDAQRPDGAFTDVAPLIIFECGGAPGWADAGIIVPWTLWKMYGDRDVLVSCYPAMQRFLEYLQRNSDNGIRRTELNLNFGDWLNADDPTDKVFVATAFSARSAALMSRIAEVLGEDKAAAEYQTQFRSVSAAVQREFWDDEAGVLSSESQGAYLLALAFELLPDTGRQRAADRLVSLIEQRGHATSGFLSIRYLLPVLCDFGYSELAYRLLLRDEYPSWLFSVRNGATTIWERWNSWTPDNGFLPDMNSFNHYALGSVVEWMYRYAAGIEVPDSGISQRMITFMPHPDERLGFCEAAFESVVGRFESKWAINGGQLDFEIDIPPGATARLRWPRRWPDDSGNDGRLLNAGRHRFQCRQADGPRKR